MPRIKHILLLTNDAGSGHRSAALALEAAFARSYGDAVQVDVRNPMHHASAPSFFRHYERAYVGQMQQIPVLYHVGYTLSELPGLSHLLRFGVRESLENAIAQLLEKQHYDLVISVYPIYTTIVSRLTRGQIRRPSLMTVVTDLGSVHDVWFSRADDICAVPTAVGRSKAIKRGLAPEQVVTTGIPVHPAFGTPRADQATLRQELGWLPDIPTLLLLGGGAGVGHLPSLATALDSIRQPLQLVVVAGKNSGLSTQLRSYDWQIPVHIYDFVPLADMMHAADIVATKAGGLTVSEALAAGKPLLIHGDPPGQEEGNLRYVQSHGAGLWISDANTFSSLVSHWLTNPAQMERAASNARRIGRPDAAQRIVRLGWELATQGPSTPRRDSFSRRWWNSTAWL